ncbi:MAG: tRNA (adenosine(37)-N6)-threonylcarbamoyltransferase complex transferase subunit TsaD [Patescibacteria group bacterium]
MNILAIESSCDETAAAVVTDGREVRSGVLSSQIAKHRVTGGIVPEVAARAQTETIIPVLEKAMDDAKMEWPDIDAIAVTRGPGLIGPLIVGVETAKALALAKDKPLIPVNHLAGHLYACLADESVFRFPYLGLVASGGHTEFVLMYGYGDFALVGSTRDDASGEAFDKVARLLGLPYPGGPEISKRAVQGDPSAFDFPRPMLNQDNLDVSFSGLKTAVRQAVGDRQITTALVNDVAASFEAAVVDTLVEKAVRAVRRHQPNVVLLGGGVAANRLLRETLERRLPVPLLLTPPELATDNAAMIGLAAYWQRDEALTDAARLRVSADPGLALATPATP